MSGRTSHRFSAVVAPLVGVALVLSACGGGSSDAESRPTIELTAGETDFATLPPATTAPPPPAGADGDADEPVSTTQEYTIQAGDFPIGVADRFGISLDELVSLNGWSVCGQSCPEFPAPGGTVRVPSTGAATSDASDANGGDTADAGDVAEEGETGEAIPAPAGDSCEAGSYTIESGDFEGRVADKFDITVDELRAANSSTADYGVFYVGLQIVIPARDDC